jgi:hypothetical protein
MLRRTGIIPRVKSVGYLYLFVLSEFFRMFCRASDGSPAAYGVMKPATRVGKAKSEARMLRDWQWSNCAVGWTGGQEQMDVAATLADSNSLYEHVNGQHVTVELMRLKNRAHPANPVEMAGPVFA